MGYCGNLALGSGGHAALHLVVLCSCSMRLLVVAMLCDAVLIQSTSA